MGPRFSPSFKVLNTLCRAALPRAQIYPSFVRTSPILRFSRTMATGNQDLPPSSPLSSPEDAPVYNWISDVEYLERYEPGGYHPVMLGDILDGRYRVVDKIGHGGYSTVWLARDTLKESYVALKVGTANSHAEETASLIQLSSPESPPFPTRAVLDSIPTPLHEFRVTGPNGTHHCYTMALAQCTLRDATFCRLPPLPVARALCGRLALTVAYIHSKNYAHGDIHLSNVLVRLPSSFNQLSVEQIYEKYGKPETAPITRIDGAALSPNVPPVAVLPLSLGPEKMVNEYTLADTRILLSDFGEVFIPDSKTRLGKDCNTPLGSRPPEARFEPEAPLSYSADIWGLGITIWEILGMKALISNEMTTIDNETAQQVDVLGPMPRDWWDRWEERDRYFNYDGTSNGKKSHWPPLETAFEEFIQKYRRTRTGAEEFPEDERVAILHLMRRMLAFRPEDRPTAEEVLKSEWMVKWVLPDFQRSLIETGEAVPDQLPS